MPPPRHGRKMALAGPSMVDNVKIARKLGYLKIPDDLLVPIDQALNMQDHKVVIMCTGSQGEPSSIVGRLSAGTNRQFDLKPGDTVVLSSHPIPGNEETISKTINRLLRRGAKVIYDCMAPGACLRACQPGRAEAADQPGASPSTFMPIHGELRQLIRHAELAKEVGICEENIVVVENGQVVELSGGNAPARRAHPRRLRLRGRRVHRRYRSRRDARTRAAGAQRHPADRPEPGQADRTPAARARDHHARLPRARGRRAA